MPNSECGQNDLTLRMLLEYPELLEMPSFDDELSYKGKDFMNGNNKYDVQSAFLGPTIWQDTIPSEFLDLPSDSFDHIDVATWLNEQSRTKESNGPHDPVDGNVIDLQPCSQTGQLQNVFLQQHHNCFLMNFEQSNDANVQEATPLNQNWENSCNLSNSSFAGPQGERVPGHPKSGVPMKAIVGDESFDPSTRAFTSDELRVAPILPKSQKNFVPFEKKDHHYWSRRQKNNTAAKRSREAKRMKENQITLRTAFLEQENSRLKDELARAATERDDLKKRLMKYEYIIE